LPRSIGANADGDASLWHFQSLAFDEIRPPLHSSFPNVKAVLFILVADFLNSLYIP